MQIISQLKKKGGDRYEIIMEEFECLLSKISNTTEDLVWVKKEDMRRLRTNEIQYIRYDVDITKHIKCNLYVPKFSRLIYEVISVSD